MIKSLALVASPSLLNLKTTTPCPPSSFGRLKFNPTTKLKAFSSNHTHNHNPPIDANRNQPPSVHLTFGSLSHAAFLVALTAFTFQSFSHLPPPSRAESSAIFEEGRQEQEEQEQEPEREGDREGSQMTDNVDRSSPDSEFVESNIETLKSLLQQKLENGEDEEALKILKRIVSAQPKVTEWKFLMARLLNEMGQTENARQLFEEILAANPLSFEALFENALLMDRCGEGEAVIRRLEEALTIAVGENKVKEARDVRLIVAQIQFLQKNVEEALKSYQQLAKEDPRDFRPYFCQGMIYSLLDRNEEAKEMFAKYRDLSPKKFEVEGYLRTPLSKMKIFGTDEES